MAHRISRQGLQRIVPVGIDRLRPVTVVLFIDDRAMERCCSRRSTPAF